MPLSSPEAQTLDPLMPGYSFNLYLVAGITPIIEDGPLDFVIDRPKGMQGYIINMTVAGQGKVFDGEDAFYTDPGDLLLFAPETVHYYGRAPGSPNWYHRWIYFRPRAYWAPWLKWQDHTRDVGKLRLPDKQLVPNSTNCSSRSTVPTGKAASPAKNWRSICWSAC